MEENVSVDDYSLASYYVETFYDETILSSATCFFTKVNNQDYIVTNWHVVSGKNADTLKCLDEKCAVPNKLRVYLPIKMDEFFQINKSNFTQLSHQNN